MARSLKNDRERSLWVENDETLYRWWKSTRQGLRPFVRDHREELDAYIANQVG